MSDDTNKSNASKLSFSFLGITFIFEPRSLYDWIPVVIITIIVSFFAFLFLGSDQIRKEIAAWINPGELAPPVAPQKPAKEPIRTDAARETAPEPVPPDNSKDPAPLRDEPQKVTALRKADPERVASEVAQEEKSSGNVELEAKQPVQQPRLYRVRKTTPINNKPFKFLPLRTEPGADEATIRNIASGTEGLIGTGRVREMHEGQINRWLGVGPTVRWIEVQFENDIGWVSSPYVEEITTAQK